MKKLALLLATISLSLCYKQASADDNSKLTNPNAFVLETGGRGHGFSLSFDRVISNRVSVGLGLGASPVPVSSGGSFSLPTYVNLYIPDSSQALFVTAGMTLLFGNKIEATGSGLESNIINNLGIGFEARGYSGFLTRVTGYALIGPSKVSPWVGVSFGYAF